MSDRSDADKFVYRGGDFVLSQCAYCKHLAPGPAAACAAFPSAIPQEILSNEADHRKPWIDPHTGRPGDTGVPLERSITFGPRAAVTPDALAALYRRLDAIHA